MHGPEQIGMFVDDGQKLLPQIYRNITDIVQDLRIVSNVLYAQRDNAANFVSSEA